MSIFEFSCYRLEVAERRLFRQGKVVPLRGKTFDTLVALVKNAGRLVRKEELLAMVWPGTTVEENNLDRNISELRGALRRDRCFVETIPRRGYRFVPEVHETGNSGVLRTREGRPLLPSQEISFFTALDGTRIAYAKAGGGPPLVKAANWLNHLEFELQSPIWTHWFAELTKRHMLVRYDERGNGLSDWHVADLSFEAWLRDFEMLVDTVGLDRFPVLGISQGGAVAVAYAALHPERVTHLILYGAFSRGSLVRNSPAELERREALMSLTRLGWGRENPAFRQMWSTLFMPEATPEQSNWFNELQRVTTSPENAFQLLETIGTIDVVDQLPKIKCPTIIFHSRRDSVVPYSEGKLLEARIGGAKFVELPSRNHLVIPPEPGWDIFLQHLGEFLGWDETAMRTVAS